MACSCCSDFGTYAIGASDATYHVMWIILFNAVDDFGIREMNELARKGHAPNLSAEYEVVEGTKQKLMDEALHGALRISGLVRMRGPPLLATT